MIALSLCLLLTVRAEPVEGPVLVNVNGAPKPHRVAVIVGSNTAVAGRGALRFAHHDAEDLADVLIHSGGFSPADVHVMLDPTPDAVIAQMNAVRGLGEDMLLFYYSGHADENALYPGGDKLSLETLKAQLGDEKISMRIGIIDACRGGSWTQAKGLSPTAPFSIGLNGLSSEGTALLASSSGLEDAHETDALGGSFFTHHLIAGLRGAADASGDGQVTLSEAFAYANRFTVRDTATRSALTQHPSFDLRLRGRQDVVLTTIGGESTQMIVAQTAGPLEVVQLSTGITVVEGLPGEQVLRLALPPGPYLVRRVDDGVVRSREVQVKVGEATRVDESALLLVGASPMPSKGVEPETSTQRRFIGQFDLGYSPIDAYANGVTINGSVTWVPGKQFGWQVLHASYAVTVKSGLWKQLERDFGVLPTAFAIPTWMIDSAAVWNPEIHHWEGSSLAATLLVGPALIGIDDASGASAGLLGGITTGASLSWTFFNPAQWPFDVGVVVAVRETIGVSAASNGVVPVFNATLGVQMGFGAGR